MGVRSYVARWGTGLAVRIPKPIAEQWGVREGSAIEIASRGAQVILTKRLHSLAENDGSRNPREPPFRSRYWRSRRQRRMVEV